MADSRSRSRMAHMEIQPQFESLKEKARSRRCSRPLSFKAVSISIQACFRLFRCQRNRNFRIQPDHCFGVAVSELTQLLEDRENLDDFQRLGGTTGLCSKLLTDSEFGLDESEQQMQRRRDEFGGNTYPRKKSKSFLSFVWDACKDTTLNILMVCAVVSLGTGIWTEGIKEGWYEGTSIAVAVLLVIFVTAGNDYKQGMNFRNLNEEKENIKLEVLRAGRRQKVSIFDLVVGDVVPLSIGGQVPADGVLVEGHSLAIDESTMTGESMPVKKDVKTKPFLLSGCKVQDGQGKMLVTGVGLNTEWGKVMASISADTDDLTPLQVRLNGAATLIGTVGLVVASVVLVILIGRYFGITFKNALPKDRRAMQVIKEMVHVFSIAVTIVVVAVPEGLPLAVTLTLAYSMRKMMADKSLVRKLAACETMGSATTICSDKTGTLTTNKMTVTKACVGGEIKSEDSVASLPLGLRKSLLDSICLNSNGNVAPQKDGESKPDVTGSPTEAAILTWGIALGMDFRATRQRNEILHVETFNSEKKRAGVVFRSCAESDGEVELHWKGAAEITLDLCTRWTDSNGEPQLMTPEKRREFNDIIQGMAAQALRCIAFARRSIDERQIPESESDWTAPDQELCLLAIAGIKDPCREGVKEAVEKCQRAGVKVRMVTGDNVYTAKAIAAECGILTNDSQLVVEGKDFRNWSEARLGGADLDNLAVMARSSPLDKLKLVEALKNRGEVVAVTGDGTNDAPALKASDIGLSMGIAGTEVAKESSDIIILDDNFTSVVKVVRWGRSVYANIQKFIQFQLTVNVVALAINFVAAVSSGEVPLTAVQLLWVNLIMDTMGALALATEAPTDALMDRAPIGRKDPLITNIMWRNIFGQALYQITVLLILTYRGIEILGLKGTHDEQVLERNTIIFNAFVFCQLFNEINARRPETFNVFQGIHRNFLFQAIIAITVFFQVIIVTFLNSFANTTMLAIKWWGMCVAIGSVALPLAVLIKCVPVPRTPLLEISCFPRASCLRLRRRRIAATEVGSSRRDCSGAQMRSGRLHEARNVDISIH